MYSGINVQMVPTTSALIEMQILSPKYYIMTALLLGKCDTIKYKYFFIQPARDVGHEV